MSERTCEIDGKIFEGVSAERPHTCTGCVGERTPTVCIQLGECIEDDIIWIAAA